MSSQHINRGRAAYRLAMAYEDMLRRAGVDESHWNQAFEAIQDVGEDFWLKLARTSELNYPSPETQALAVGILQARMRPEA